jgi:phosphoglycolate phosphatase
VRSSDSLDAVQKLLIFDLDGTLVESLPGIAASLNRALAMNGLPMHGEAAVRSFIGDGARMLVTRALAPCESAPYLESVLHEFAEDYAVSWQQGTQPYPGIIGLLQNLNALGIPLAVLSNKPHTFTEQIVARLFRSIDFAMVLGNHDDLPHKPDPAGAFEIATRLGIAPEQGTIIGDSTMDLDTARNAGMKSIAVTWGYHDRERLLGADRIAQSVGELAGILNG